MNLLKLCRNQWDRVTGVALVVTGLAAVVVAWIAVSGTDFAFEQIPYLLSGGLVGVCLVGLGGTLWLSADIRDEWSKLDRLEEAVRGAAAPHDAGEQRPTLDLADAARPGSDPAPSGTARRLRVSEG